MNKTISQSIFNSEKSHLFNNTVSERLWPEKDIQIGAQVYLEKVYQQFGFARNSENYLEDGILHVDMMLSKVC